MYCPFCGPFRIHIDVMQAEAGANLKKLLEIEKRLFLSTDDLKIQHGKSVQVGNVSVTHFPSFFLNTLFLTGHKAPWEKAPYYIPTVP